MDFKAMGKRIRALRKKAGITQRELAEAVGVSREFITVLEAGYRIPTVTTLCGIAEKLNVTIDYLIYGDKEKANA